MDDIPSLSIASHSSGIKESSEAETCTKKLAANIVGFLLIVFIFFAGMGFLIQASTIPDSSQSDLIIRTLKSKKINIGSLKATRKKPPSLSRTAPVASIAIFLETGFVMRSPMLPNASLIRETVVERPRTNSSASIALAELKVSILFILTPDISYSCLPFSGHWSARQAQGEEDCRVQYSKSI